MSDDPSSHDELQLTSSPKTTEDVDGPPLPGRPNWSRLFHPSLSELHYEREMHVELKLDSNLYPYVRPLTISDLESCVALENAAFEEHERCSREKFIYRLTKCPELTLGLFCTIRPDSDTKAETLAAGRLVETSRERKDVSVLLAHIVATLSDTEVVTDETMDYPRDWESSHPQPSPLGHQATGRTICLHSLGVVPSFQGQGLGSILMQAYLQQMNGAGIADHIALIAHSHIAPFYINLGFESRGASKAQFGGGGWTDLTYKLKSIDKMAVYG